MKLCPSSILLATSFKLTSLWLESKYHIELALNVVFFKHRFAFKGNEFLDFKLSPESLKIHFNFFGSVTRVHKLHTPLCVSKTS